MPVGSLAYAILGARLTISPEFARLLAKRFRMPHSLADDRKAFVRVTELPVRSTARYKQQAVGTTSHIHSGSRPQGW
jgi:hypothetical protein